MWIRNLTKKYEGYILLNMTTEFLKKLALGVGKLNVPEREKQMMMYRHGIPNNLTRHTLEETGRVFKVTRERIRQVEEKILRMLKLTYKNK